MTVFNPTSQSMGVVNYASGALTSDNAAGTIKIGFKARHVEVFNETDVILWTKMEGMVAANTRKVVTAGDLTVDTASAIVINTDGTFTISATAMGNAKALRWAAWG